MAERFFVSVGITIFFPLFFCVYYVLMHDYPFLLAAYYFVLDTYPILFWFLLVFLVSKRALFSSVIAAVIYAPINYYFSIVEARSSNLTLRDGGVDLYFQGEITEAGKYDKIEYYILVFLILFLTSFLVSGFVKRFTDAN
ncbi:hypothetical protein [Roseibium sediminicola]|uniref:Uncharacterized protein n=1 Tax=Roseibium sediminicola TaxID=2933272 RepID=A0ABT0GVX0_9HYPH|nr:hypothetical protein [Roseibium sp. CAU 1639]MCK7613599.1 hypothetical protein [Roseibium sp. CAU 1639]